MLNARGARRAPGAFVRRLYADRAGVAAVEFAFIGPILIVLFFGLAQLSEAIVASRHASHTASAVGDLVSQCDNINDTDLANIFAAGGDVMAPLPATTAILAQRVTDVQETSSGPQAQWSQAADKPGFTTAYTQNQPVANLPANVLSSTVGDSVIVDQTVYAYTFPVGAGGLLPMGKASVSLSFGQSINFNILTYFKPRKSTTVTYTGTGSGGSGAGSGNQGASCYSS